jgi:hypothetical protein
MAFALDSFLIFKARKELPKLNIYYHPVKGMSDINTAIVTIG